MGDFHILLCLRSAELSNARLALKLGGGGGGGGGGGWHGGTLIFSYIRRLGSFGGGGGGRNFEFQYYWGFSEK